MTDTPISLLKTILAGVEDECTCNQTRDKCLHCRIDNVLAEHERTTVRLGENWKRIQALQRDLASAERTVQEYRERLEEARLI